MLQEGFKRKLTALFSADVEGYSRLLALCLMWHQYHNITKFSQP